MATVPLLVAGATLVAQKPVIEPDLTQVTQGAAWQVVGRVATVLDEGGRSGVRLSEAPGSGFARLQGVQFDEGVIEVALRGRNVPQRSFLGIAFHGLDDETWDAVYFRPFNFLSADSAARSHGVQYVSHPTFTWQKLRGESPGTYEQAVEPAPNPDDWFRARIVVREGTVSVFVNDAAAPSLVVRQLSDRRGGWIGLWVGNGSGGDFAELRLTPASP
jgi:hypothetical protein